MKYGRDRKAKAIYGDDQSQTPLVSALPDVLSEHEFTRAIASSPVLPVKEKLRVTERRKLIAQISSVFVPMNYMYPVYEQLMRMMYTTYTTKTSVDSVRRINAIFANTQIPFATQAQSAALLGTPGIGKTSLVRRCMATIPQVIEHERYCGQPFFYKQITYLIVECPSDCSVKTLSYNIAMAIDNALGSNYTDYLNRLRSVAASSSAAYIKSLCLTHNVGLLVVDEVQNMVISAKKSTGLKSLISFLVELTNDTSTSIYFVGTNDADEAFQQQEHLKRRVMGLRLLPLRPDGAYRAFLEALWPCQYTYETAEFTDALANQIYDFSAGIPAYISRLFEEAQSQALLAGEKAINSKILRQAVNALGLSPSKKMGRGISISDFMKTQDSEFLPLGQQDEQKRLYAKPRGRKPEARDEKDIIAWYQNGNLMERLMAEAMLEVTPC